jgi:hypothetical protein
MLIYLILVKSVWSKADYFAELIYEDLIALEMSATDLVRLLVSRSEVDLFFIFNEIMKPAVFFTQIL